MLKSKRGAVDEGVESLGELILSITLVVMILLIGGFVFISFRNDVRSISLHNVASFLDTARQDVHLESTLVHLPMDTYLLMFGKDSTLRPGVRQCTYGCVCTCQDARLEKDRSIASQLGITEAIRCPALRCQKLEAKMGAKIDENSALSIIGGDGAFGIIPHKAEFYPLYAAGSEGKDEVTLCSAVDCTVQTTISVAPLREPNRDMVKITKQILADFLGEHEPDSKYSYESIIRSPIITQERKEYLLNTYGAPYLSKRVSDLWPPAVSTGIIWQLNIDHHKEPYSISSRSSCADSEGLTVTAPQSREDLHTISLQLCRLTGYIGPSTDEIRS